MKKIFIVLFDFVYFCSCLINSSRRTKYKIHSSIYFFFITLAYPVLRISNKKTIHFNKLVLYGANFETLYYLFGENFIKNQYFFLTDNKTPTIIDAGANIGDSCIYLNSLYPKAKIHCFEPSDAFQILKQNIKENNVRAKINRTALSSKNGFLYLVSDEESNILTHTTKKPNGNKVKCIKLSKYMSDKKIRSIDLLKLDIEGSETDVLVDLIKSKSISQVKNIIIEFHHNMHNANKLEFFLAKLSNFGFTYQLEAIKIPPYKHIPSQQDVMIYATK